MTYPTAMAPRARHAASKRPEPRVARLTPAALVRQTGLGFLRHAARKRFSLYLMAADVPDDMRLTLLAELRTVLEGGRATVSVALRHELEHFFKYRSGLWEVGFRYVDESRRTTR